VSLHRRTAKRCTYWSLSHCELVESSAKKWISCAVWWRMRMILGGGIVVCREFGCSLAGASPVPEMLHQPSMSTRSHSQAIEFPIIQWNCVHLYQMRVCLNPFQLQLRD